MCGIWGIFTKSPQGYLNKPDIEMARTMNIMSSIRGDHSTGICVIPQLTTADVVEHWKPRICKNVGGPHNILHTKIGMEFLDWASIHGNSIFGHNRHATRGEISVGNAHPFKEGDWILVHNGTIHSGLNHGEEGEPEVDSHALCMKINEVGLKDALLSITGAYAILAYNVKTRTMYAARNKERPLYHFGKGSMEYVMSEENALLYSVLRHNRGFFKKEEGSNEPIIFDEDHLYQLTAEGFVKTEEVKKAPADFPIKHVGQNVYEIGRPRPRAMARITKPTEKRLITFVVDTIEKDGGMYKYNCMGDVMHENKCVDVFFTAKFNRPDLLDKVGEAPLNLEYTDKNSKAFHVKYREIVWLDDEDPVGPKKVIACNQCAEEIKGPDMGIELHGGGRICRSCVNEFIKNQGSVVGVHQ